MPGPTVDIDPIDSPCIGVCTVHKRGDISVCIGCWRTLKEIAHWRDLTRPERAAVLATCATRKQTLKR
jgi:predicted Fe-S protein YdhL (DUF1289 family)